MDKLECQFCKKTYPLDLFFPFCPVCHEPMLIFQALRARSFSGAAGLSARGLSRLPAARPGRAQAQPGRREHAARPAREAEKKIRPAGRVREKRNHEPDAELQGPGHGRRRAEGGGPGDQEDRDRVDGEHGLLDGRLRGQGRPGGRCPPQGGHDGGKSQVYRHPRGRSCQGPRRLRGAISRELSPRPEARHLFREFDRPPADRGLQGHELRDLPAARQQGAAAGVLSGELGRPPHRPDAGVFRPRGRGAFCRRRRSSWASRPRAAPPSSGPLPRAAKNSAGLPGPRRSPTRSRTPSRRRATWP